MGFNTVLQFILGSKFIWKIVRNYGLIKKVISDSESVLQGMMKRSPPIPDCNETKLLLGNLVLLFDAELVDIPGVDETDLKRVVSELEHNLVCSFEAHKKGKKS